MRRLLKVLAALCVIAPFGSAFAARNIALVIGNDIYTNVPALKKAVNDARSIGQELEKLGFIVRRVENADQRKMSRALVEFNADVQPGDRALFYYSGHGFEIGGTNYLLPTDVPAAKRNEQDLVKDAAFPVDRVIDGIRERGAGVTVLVLDACRDNPFAIQGTRALPGTSGLARMAAPEGVFVLMSAGAKQEALDRLSDDDADPNSVFTRAFLKELQQPGQTLVQIAKKTQIDVKTLAASVGHEQTPAYYDQVIGDVILTDRGTDATPVAVTPPQAGQQVALLDPSAKGPAVDPEHVSSNVKTQINIANQTHLGQGVTANAGVQIGPGVIVGNKEAKVAINHPANPPGTNPAQRQILVEGAPGSQSDPQKIALLQPDPNVGALAQGVGQRAPIANFSRHNSGWTITISTPEPAVSVAYRVGDIGEFKDTGQLDILDPRTGQRMPKSQITLSGKAETTIIHVKYRTADGNFVGPFPIRFDPEVALFDSQKKTLEDLWPSWIEFGGYNKPLAYTTTMMSYRCAIAEVRYGLDGAKPLTRINMPPCDMKDPHAIPDDVDPYLEIPAKTKSMSLQITWRDGTQSEVNTIERD